jgi:hypothetical protein
MKWPWSKPKPPRIPPYREPAERERPKPKDDGLVVEEHDTSAMTRTGIHRAWRRLTGKDEG